jgi:carbon-monoxide dehydrogenase small subunit
VRRRRIDLTVNGRPLSLEAPPNRLLIDVLRSELGLTGTKLVCELGVCGACTVLLDGRCVNSCLILAVEADGATVTTVEGLLRDGRLSPLQEAFVEHGGMQCGYCTPGMVMAAKALLDEHPHPTAGEIREHLAGNLCRCTGYVKIVEAVQAAAAAITDAPAASGAGLEP